MYRNTYVEVNLDNLKYNLETIIDTTKEYEYHFGVVKADCYGCGLLGCLDTVINSGCNYLAVATLDEALEIRNINKDIPILCLGEIDKKYLDIAVKNNVTITINSKDYLNDIKIDRNLKVHIKINTGMNRLGLSNNEDVLYVYDHLKDRVEGIYTHIYEPSSSINYQRQIDKFVECINGIDLNKIKIIHTSASEAMLNFKKLDFVNGCRIGISMYGFYAPSLNLKSVFSLYSEVIQINNLKKGDTVGYDGTYKALGEEKIAVVSIGYADGIIRKNKGRFVYINNKKYEIVGNICMDMLFVKIDDDVNIYDKVILLKDNEHINYVSDYLETIPYEIMCSIGKRVKRNYIKNV